MLTHIDHGREAAVRASYLIHSSPALRLTVALSLSLSLRVYLRSLIDV